MDRSIPTVDIEFGSARYSAWRALRAACCLARRVDRSIPTVYVEFGSGFPLWTLHLCVFTPITTVRRYLLYCMYPEAASSRATAVLAEGGKDMTLSGDLRPG